MARKKLALVAFERGEGPWIRAQGNEQAVRASMLREGEILCLEIEGQLGGRHLKAGYTTVELEKGMMYRFTKTVPEGQRPSKTCVEVMLNGPTNGTTDAGTKRG